MLIFSLIILSVALNAAGQLLLKHGMNQVGYFDFSWANVLPISINVLSNFWIMAGIGIYIASLISWLMILSRTDVSYAFPLVSLAYIINAFAAAAWLGESVTATRMIGIVVITLGVVLVAKS